MSTRMLIVALAIVVVGLFASDETSYKIPVLDVTVGGVILWPMLAVVQIVLVAKAYLTGEVSHVMAPWRVPREGPWGNKSVKDLPEYWVVFFNQVIPAIAIPISLVLIAIRIVELF